MSNVTTPSHYPTAEPTSHRPTNTKIPTHMPSFKPSKAPSPMPTGCIDVSASQLTGLEDLYNSSRGESWQWTADQVAWNFSQSSPNPCRENWAYITCSSCSITELSIESNIGMRGTIPPTISYLTHLKSLSIMNNDHLTGFIPTTIGSLSKVTYLDFSGNTLSGPIPDSIGNIYGLQELYLFSNRLWGTIPSSIGKLAPSLKKLSLNYNLLEGPITASIGNLTNLVYLELFSNQLTGTIPMTLCNLKQNLQRLYLYDNRLVGTIPNCIEYMVGLTRIYLQQNALYGTIPQAIGQTLLALQAVKLSENQLTGPVLQIVHKPVLDRLDLHSNRLSGEISPSYGQLPSLQYLDLSHNLLNGSIPTTLNFLPQLTNLYLNNNQLGGILPLTIGNLTSLQYLYLFYNEFSGPLPLNIGALDQLVDLDIYGNGFTGKLPLSLWKLHNIEIFTADSNYFSGSLPIIIDQLTHLKFFSLGMNQLSGPLPASLGMLPSLTTLYLSHNLFSKQLPLHLGNISALTFLDLSCNGFTGSLPNAYKNMTQIQMFNMSFNSLTGTISDEFFDKFLELNNLDISNNDCSGTLPISLGFLPQLAVLQLSNNRFTGRLPSFANWTSIAVLALSNNLLSQTLPEYFQSLSKVQTVLLDNNMFSGSLLSFQTGQIDLHETVDNLFTPFPFLECLDVSSNFFTGEVPASLFFRTSSSASNTCLKVLVLASNCLSWKYFASDICQVATSLKYLILDGMNAATSCHSPIFPDIFKIPTFTTNSAITSSIPACLFNNAENLLSLHLANTGIFASFLTNEEVYAMPAQLSDLTLSNNFLLGTIPEILQQYPNFSISLDLSYNRLYGTLSDRIFTSFHSIVVDENSTAPPSLSLDINRLSGDIPNQLRSVDDINILSGNIFSCNADRSDLPKNDPVHKSFHCGSQLVNETIFTWLVTIVCSAAVFAYVLKVWGAKTKLIAQDTTIIDENRVTTITPIQSKKSRKHSTIWEATGYSWMLYWNEVTDGNVQNSLLITLRAFIFTLSYELMWYVVVLSVLCIPITVLFATYFPTVQPDYAWTVSFANKVGIFPAVTLLILQCVVFALCWYWWCRPLHANSSSLRAWSRSMQRSMTTSSRLTTLNTLFEQQSQQQDVNTDHSFSLISLLQCIHQPHTIWHWILKTCLVLIFALVVIFVVNIYFVKVATASSANSPYQDNALLLITIATSLFKIVYTSMLHRYAHGMVKDITIFLLHPWGTTVYQGLQNSVMFVIFFGNLLAPCISLLIVDENCFYHAFIPAKQIVSTYQYQVETRVVLPTTVYTYLLQVNNKQIVVDASFQYYYNCSSTMLITLADIFIFRFLIKALLLPIATLLIKLLQAWWIQLYISERAPRTIGCRNPLHDDAESPTRIKTAELAITHIEHQERETGNIKDASNEAQAAAKLVDVHPTKDLQWFEWINSRCLPYCWRYYSIEDGMDSSTDASLHDPNENRLFYSVYYVTNTVIDLSLILTFGLYFPPLGIIGSISIILEGCWKLLSIGRMLHIFQNDVAFQRRQLQTFREEIMLLQESFHKACWKMLLWIIPILWALFVFDLLGGEVGGQRAWWVVLVITMGLPGLLIGLQYLLDRNKLIRNGEEEVDVGSHSQVEVEMSTTAIAL